MKALVTGSSGFIASNLVKYLEAKGYTVIPYDIKTGQDILNREQLEETFKKHSFDEVYHLAAQAFVGPGEANPYLDLRINAEGMLNMLHCIEKHRVPMVFTSSGSVYGLTDSFPHTEKALIRPTANYGCTKRLAELYLQKWVIMTGIEAKIVRFSSVYGPGRGMNGPVNVFVSLALKGKPLTVYGDGSQTRDTVYIEDALHGLFTVQHHGIPGEIYNVGCGEEHSVKEVAEIVSQLTNTELSFIKGHKFSKFDVKRSYYDITKLKNIGYTPHYTLQEGILETLNIEQKTQTNKIPVNIPAP